MNLQPADFINGTWDRLRADLAERLESMRKRNDGDLDAAETARLRGQIAELKYWLSLPAPQPPRQVPVGNLEE